MPGPTLPPDAAPSAQLRVSAYDQASSLLLAMLVLVGSVAAALLPVWFAMRGAEPAPPVAVTMVELNPGEGGGHALGEGSEGMLIEGPESDEFPTLGEVVEESLLSTLDNISRTTSLYSARLDEPYLGEDAPVLRGRSRGTGDRVAQGSGSGEPGLPRPQRWEVEYGDSITLQEYSAILDFFKIELAAIGQSNTIELASKFGQQKPSVRTLIASANETRLYFSWRRGSSREAADRELLVKAGVQTENRVLVQFIPDAVEQTLVKLEKQYAGRDPKDTRRTRFGVQKAEQGFEFHVLSQQPVK
ncbi:MAG: hypothetical protein SGJ19_13025 [Planctomycetia bacterium]|nr:hypothetical protein [Planctomycetia bacterium]